MMVKPAVFDYARGFDHLARQRAILEHGGDRIEGGVGGCVQVAVERRRLGAKRKAAQHLAGMLPERRADFSKHDVAGRHLAIGGKLCGHGEGRVRHCGHANKMNDVSAAERHVGALNKVAEFALAQARPQSVVQRRHAAIGQRRADPHPIDFLGRLDLAQPYIGAVKIGDHAEAAGERRVLLERHRPDHADAAVLRAAPLQHLDRGADRRPAAPGDLARALRSVALAARG